MSQPITIRAPNHHHRQRSGSVSSSDSDSPPTLSTPVDPPAQTPAVSSSPILSYFLNNPSIVPTPNTNGMAKSPTFPSLGRVPFGSTAMVENDSPPSSPTQMYPGSLRNRRLNSVSWQPPAGYGAGGGTMGHPNGTAAPPTSPTQAGAEERAGGILRRFSLSGAFSRPSAGRPSSPPSHPPVFEGVPAAKTQASFPLAPPSPQQRKGRRASMLAVPGEGRAESPTRVRRAPSPMGERILKGHFDGFN